MDVDSSLFPKKKRYFEPFDQHDLNNLTRDIDLSKESAYLIGSRLDEWKMFSKETTLMISTL